MQFWCSDQKKSSFGGHQTILEYAGIVGENYNIVLSLSCFFILMGSSGRVVGMHKSVPDLNKTKANLLLKKLSSNHKKETSQIKDVIFEEVSMNC